MKAILKRLWANEQGQNLTEYALLLVLLSLAAIATMNTLGKAINATFNATFTKVVGNLSSST